MRPVRRGIDRQHCDPVTLAGQKDPQRIDRGRFADPGDPGDADPDRLTGCGEQILHQPPRRGLMVSALRLNEGDRTRQYGAVAGPHPAAQGRHVGAARISALGGHASCSLVRVKRVFSNCLGITPIVLNWYIYGPDSVFTDCAGSRRPPAPGWS
jgi:hypothetical protein